MTNRNSGVIGRRTIEAKDEENGRCLIVGGVEGEGKEGDREKEKENVGWREEEEERTPVVVNKKA